MGLKSPAPRVARTKAHLKKNCVRKTRRTDEGSAAAVRHRQRPGAAGRGGESRKEREQAFYDQLLAFLRQADVSAVLKRRPVGSCVASTEF